jgi:hypothetical protein
VHAYRPYLSLLMSQAETGTARVSINVARAVVGLGQAEGQAPRHAEAAENESFLLRFGAELLKQKDEWKIADD